MDGRRPWWVEVQGEKTLQLKAMRYDRKTGMGLVLVMVSLVIAGCAPFSKAVLQQVPWRDPLHLSGPPVGSAPSLG